jgi:hypothetical protein
MEPHSGAFELQTRILADPRAPIPKDELIRTRILPARVDRAPLAPDLRKNVPLDRARR